ncbi:MAG: SH3 domain-containing protein [Anaerolineae bacterium]|nr:SH3 domain-containing protein [Anaerolineae bacterium]
MFRRLSLSLGLMLALLVVVLPVLAQDAPGPINAALADLSSRVGRNVALTDLQNWSYVQSNFPSTALGCPQPGVLYSDVVTGGFQFTLIHDGTSYDYRVSNDQRIIILCGTTPAAEPTPACPPVGDSDYLPPRLAVGTQARVEAGGLPNVLRDQPGSSGKLLGQIPSGDVFVVLDGPRCSLLDKIVWWQVNYNGAIGWTAEGDDGDYWLEPLNLVGTPVSVGEALPLSAANVNLLVPLVNVAEPAALSADGQRVASTTPDGKGITITDSATGTILNSITNLPGVVVALTFNPKVDTQLAVGLDIGSVLILDASTPGTLTQRRALSGHQGAVNALAYSPDGRLLASGGADGVVQVWSPDAAAPLATLSGHTAPVTRVEFSADGSVLISRGEKAIFWGLPSAG